MPSFELEKANKKKEEILQYLKDELGGEIPYDLLKVELEKACIITPGYSDSNLIPLGKGQPLSDIVLADDVVYSIKKGNIKINYKKLLEPLCETGLSVLEAVAHPYLLILVGLLATKKIFGLTKIVIKDRHAVVIASLWSLSDKGTLIIPRKDLTKRINELLSQVNKDLLTDSQLDSILSDLDDIKSIRLNKDGTISLIEKIEIEF